MLHEDRPGAAAGHILNEIVLNQRFNHPQAFFVPHHQVLKPPQLVGGDSDRAPSTLGALKNTDAVKAAKEDVRTILLLIGLFEFIDIIDEPAVHLFHQVSDGRGHGRFDSQVVVPAVPHVRVQVDVNALANGVDEVPVLQHPQVLGGSGVVGWDTDLLNRQPVEILSQVKMGSGLFLKLLRQQFEQLGVE